MTRTEADKMVADVVATAKRELVEERSHAYVVTIHTDEGTALLDLDRCVAMAENLQEGGDTEAAVLTKDLIADLIRTLCADVQADGLIQVMQAGVEYPEDSSRRVQALVIMHEFRLANRTRLTGVRMIEYSVGPDDRVSFGKETEVGEASGRFTGLLP